MMEDESGDNKDDNELACVKSDDSEEN